MAYERHNTSERIKDPFLSFSIVKLLLVCNCNKNSDENVSNIKLHRKKVHKSLI